MSSSPSSSTQPSRARRPSRREYEGPSRARRRGNIVNEVWPEPFLEALAFQVALDSSRFAGRLAAAQALANVFQVCTTWRAVSRSNLLWARLTEVIWGRTLLLQDTWQEEYIFRHRTARNFLTGTSTHYTLHFDPADVDPGDPDALICRRLALSDSHLACGFADGSVRLFDLRTRRHARTFRPDHGYRLGRFSRAVSGIVLGPGARLVFAALDGNVHVATIDCPAQPRVAHAGNIVEDGALVDFAGCSRWWVGLFAGARGRSFHIWDSATEARTFVGGTLTDPEAVVGWHTLTELITEEVGRVRVIPARDIGVACTRLGLVAFSLREQGVVLGGEQYQRRGVVVGSFDVAEGAYVIVDTRGWATVRRVDDLAAGEVCRFRARAQRGVALVGCRNVGYALMCAGGVTRVFGLEMGGEYLYAFGDGVGEVNALVADERHVAAGGGDMWVDLWDFGAV